MSGSAGLLLTGLGLWTHLDGRQAFAAVGVAAILFSAFLVWRDEYRKTAETREERAERDVEFQAQIAQLTQTGDHWISALRSLARDGRGSAGDGDFMTLHSLARSLVLLEGGVVFVNPIYARRVRAWAQAQLESRLAAVRAAASLPPPP